MAQASTRDGAAAAPSIAAGRPGPFGVHWHADGVHVAVWAPDAVAVWIGLRDAAGAEWARLRLPACSEGVWHGVLMGLHEPFGYVLYADGPQGGAHDFHPERPLLDPYARRFAGGSDAALHVPPLAWSQPEPAGDAVAPPRPPRPDVALVDTVLYEVHVKGFTQQHPAVPDALRGSYLGLCHPAAIAHFRRLGITTLSLLPVHAARDETPLRRRGLVNYWGYNTVGYFAANPRHASRRHLADPSLPFDPDAEFRTMVDTLHAHGLEVLIDVVYNHTAEGGQDGPTFSWRGLGNAAWYRFRPDEPARYDDLTGCGNTLDVSRPRVLQMVLDSLRHWALHFGVDGFRFDLAPVLGRTASGFSPDSAFFQAVAQDPVLSRLKLVAEPWDLGPGGYQCGGFPAPWTQWNDRYRRAVRAFWLTRSTEPAEMRARIAGSPDIAAGRGGSVLPAVNYVTSHDGFTLLDLVSYQDKHNDDNGEHNRDGTNENLSWNCGIEGPTDLLAINAVRGQLRRALLATLLVSRGVPMLLGGDELGRTQRGNNNAYCQDSPVSWFDWRAPDEALTDCVARLVALRRELPALRRPVVMGAPAAPGRAADGTQWSSPAADADGHEPRFCLCAHVPGRPAGDGAPAEDAVFLVFNAEGRDVPFTLPPGAWRLRFDSFHADGAPAVAAGRAPAAGSAPAAADDAPAGSGDPVAAAPTFPTQRARARSVLIYSLTPDP